MHTPVHTIGGEQTPPMLAAALPTDSAFTRITFRKCIGMISDRDLKLAFAVEPKMLPDLVKDACVSAVYEVKIP
jgi:hypothetical protein